MINMNRDDTNKTIINDDDVEDNDNMNYDPDDDADDDEDEEDDFEFNIDDHNVYDTPKTYETNTPASVSNSHQSDATHITNNNDNEDNGNDKNPNAPSKVNYLSDSNPFRDYGEAGEIDLDSYSSDDVGAPDNDDYADDESYSSGSLSTEEEFDNEKQTQYNQK